MAEYSFLRFIILMAVINVGLGLFDAAVYSYNSDYNGTIDISNSPIAPYMTNGTLDSGFIANVSNALPDSADSVDTETGNIFTDTWKSVKNWIF